MLVRTSFVFWQPSFWTLGSVRLDRQETKQSGLFVNLDGQLTQHGDMTDRVHTGGRDEVTQAVVHLLYWFNGDLHPEQIRTFLS